jgi:hypothetical protein
MTKTSPAIVTPEMIEAASRVLGHKHRAVVALVPALYVAMRLARPLAEGPGIPDAGTKRSGVAAILLRILILAVFIAIWHARG